MCSNPDCRAITTGPAETLTAVVNVGEAAHIFGANLGSARYRADMTSAERRDATNAIWLCRNCHKLIDADEARHPPGSLYEWRRLHEESVRELVGKAESSRRRHISKHLLEGFESESGLAQQIVLDKPYAWEYRLTTELLRSKMDPLLSRWRSLAKGLYAKPVLRVQEKDVMEWWGDRLHEVSELTPALSAIMNEEFAQSWGEPGQPGSASEILRVSNLFVENCSRLLEWEERVRFVRLPDQYTKLQTLLPGVAGRLIEQVSKAPQEMSRIFANENPEGLFEISIVIDLPDGWVENCEATFTQILKDARKRSFWES